MPPSQVHSPVHAQNEFPEPANARPPLPPAPPVASRVVPAANQPPNLASALRGFAGQEVFTLDPDLRPALEDMCQAALGRNWREGWSAWLSKMVSEALQFHLRG
jgi:hypothetical protein